LYQFQYQFLYGLFYHYIASIIVVFMVQFISVKETIHTKPQQLEASMLYPTRIARRFSSLLQALVAGVAAVALAVSIFAATDVTQPSEPLAQTATPEVTPFTIAELYAGWNLYDGGWASGPGSSYTKPISVWAAYAGWNLYDGGWAGGPGASYTRP
jgi:hypothetical protein